MILAVPLQKVTGSVPTFLAFFGQDRRREAACSFENEEYIYYASIIPPIIEQ